MHSDQARIDQMAARWIARQEAGLTAGEERELAQWLAADPRHGKSYREVMHSWARFDALRGTEAGARLQDELGALARRRIEPRRASWASFGPWISGALAASVVWAVVYFAWWQPNHLRSNFAEMVTTEIGDVRVLDLPDGSSVRLNTNSALSVTFSGAERRVRLSRGEAFFTVAKDRARPFVVTAAGVDVRAIGTEFNVRLRNDRIDVVVREGKVRVEDAASGASLLSDSPPRATEPDILGAGHRALIPLAAPRPVLADVERAIVNDKELDRALAWHERRLVFEAAPLGEIVAEFNRYNRRQIVVEEEALALRRFGGTFETNDPRTFLELLSATDGIVAEERDGTTRLRGP